MPMPRRMASVSWLIHAVNRSDLRSEGRFEPALSSTDNSPIDGGCPYVSSTLRKDMLYLHIVRAAAGWADRGARYGIRAGAAARAWVDRSSSCHYDRKASRRPWQ